METLDKELEECQENTRSVNQAQPRKHQNFTSKDLLEKHGVEFLEKTIVLNSVQMKLTSSRQTLLSQQIFLDYCQKTKLRKWNSLTFAFEKVCELIVIGDK
jgi:hypothetical protein